MQRAVKDAVRAAGLAKPATCHTFRHSFATRLLEESHDIWTVQELLRRHDVSTTMSPPGAGETMLARRLATVLPPLSLEEAIDVSVVWSVCGLLPGERGLVTAPRRALVWRIDADEP